MTTTPHQPVPNNMIPPTHVVPTSGTGTLVEVDIDCHPPAEILAKTKSAARSKADMPISHKFILAMMAGVFIGFGGIFFLLVLADHSIGFAAQRVVGGLVFSVGLSLVIIAGAELLTGNCLMLTALFDHQISTRQLLRSWSIVWLGNLVGSIVLALLAFWSHIANLNNGEVDKAILTLADGKLTPDLFTLFIKAILCNILVCLAVWSATAGRSSIDKIVALTLPVALFVAAGFEHSVANMFFLPYAWLQAHFGAADNTITEHITLLAITRNIVVVTLGNLVGGSLVGVIYSTVYQRNKKPYEKLSGQ